MACAGRSSRYHCPDRGPGPRGFGRAPVPRPRRVLGEISRSGASGSRVNTWPIALPGEDDVSAQPAVSLLPDAEYGVTVTSASGPPPRAPGPGRRSHAPGRRWGSRSRSRRSASSISRSESSCTPIASISTSRVTLQAVVAKGPPRLPGSVPVTRASMTDRARCWNTTAMPRSPRT